VRKKEEKGAGHSVAGISGKKEVGRQEGAEGWEILIGMKKSERKT